jgi:hypothetical protein
MSRRGGQVVDSGTSWRTPKTAVGALWKTGYGKLVEVLSEKPPNLPLIYRIEDEVRIGATKYPIENSLMMVGPKLLSFNNMRWMFSRAI